MHTTTGPGALEVLALPFDPARTMVLDSAYANGAPSSPASVAVVAVRDSALQFDTVFQRSRAELNREALALRTQQRASVTYGRAFDLWSKRANEAVKIRATRDRLRARLTAIDTVKNTASLSSTHFPMLGRFPIVQIDAAARRNGGGIVRADLGNGEATLALPARVWWIALKLDDSTALIHPQPITIAVGSSDTLRLPSR